MKKGILLALLGSFILLITGCSSTNAIEINMLATTDLHGYLPYNLTSYIRSEKSKDKNTVLVDAGDFLDFGEHGSAMNKYFDTKWSNDKYDTKYLETPIVSEMKDVGYDAVTLGNHEFIENNKNQLDNLVSDFKKYGIDLLSANTYEKDGKNYISPYTIKNISTPEGNLKLGILGLTIQEVGQTYETSELTRVKPTSEGLKDFQGYNGSLYMDDLVEDAKKWIDVMKKEDTDIIVAVVHSGEKSDVSKYPGNRIEELAKEINGIDAIVAGHTHKKISQHNYKNKLGENIIVTQPGEKGSCISKINFKLNKNNNKWDIEDKSSKLINFEKNKEDKNFDALCDKFMEFTIDTKLNDKGKIRLKKITPFSWDKAYVFEPSTSSKKIYDTIGYKWRDIKETNGDDMIQMIFMKNNKVVCNLYGYQKYLNIGFVFNKSHYKNNVLTIYPNKNDLFEYNTSRRYFITSLKYLN